jgi:hypothetical protein
MATQAAATRMSIGRRRRITAPALAGIAYSAAWLLGLAVWPSNLDVAATNAKVVATFSAHQSAAVTQFLLVEGVAAIALAVVVLALGQAARRRGAARASHGSRRSHRRRALADPVPSWAVACRIGSSRRKDRTGRPPLRPDQPHGRRQDVRAGRNGNSRHRSGSACGASPLAGLYRSPADGGSHRLRRRLSAPEHDARAGGVRIRAAATGLGDRGGRCPLASPSVACSRGRGLTGRAGRPASSARARSVIESNLASRLSSTTRPRFTRLVESSASASIADSSSVSSGTSGRGSMASRRRCFELAEAEARVDGHGLAGHQVAHARGPSSA